jgi:hypothetical protein
MADRFMHEWDKDHEPYEDFLERLPPGAQEQLAAGQAYMATPLDGFKIMETFILSSERDKGMEVWKSFVKGISTEDEAKQMISDIASLEVVATSIANALLKRRHEIHMEGCEVCRGKDKKGSNIHKALDAARDAFMQAIEGEDEDDEEGWKDGNADPNAWKDEHD